MDLTDEELHALLDAAADEFGMASIPGVGDRWQSSLPNNYDGCIDVWYSFVELSSSGPGWHKRTS